MNPTITNKLEEYKNWLISNGKSKNTIYQYMPYIKKFLEHVNVNDLSEINQVMLLSFIAQEFPKFGQQRNNTMCEAINKFCKYNNLKELNFPKQKKAVTKRIKKPITEEELSKLTVEYLSWIFENHLEIKTLIYFLFYTGLRRQEVINLKRSDFDFENSNVTVWINKQRFNREVPLADNLKLVLKKYFHEVPEITNAFNTSKGKIGYMMKKLKESEIFGKNRDIWNHLWRDSYACMSLRKGIDIHELQQLMGHKDITTTLKYVTMCNDRVQKKWLSLVKGIL